MHICLDIQSAIAQRAGIGRYTRMLLSNLAGLRGADEISCFYFDFPAPAALAPARRRRPPGRALAPRRLVQQSWKRLNWPPFDRLAGYADVYHFPNFIIPPLRRGRAVATIHDLSFLRHPDFTEARNLAYLRARLDRMQARADAIITDSGFCAAEIEDLLPASRGKTAAVHLGIGPEFDAPCRRPCRLARPARLELPYLLSVGTLEPRKHYQLIDVFERLPGFDGELVIAGRRGWKCEPILERMRAVAPRRAHPFGLTRKTGNCRCCMPARKRCCSHRFTRDSAFRRWKPWSAARRCFRRRRGIAGNSGRGAWIMPSLTRKLGRCRPNVCWTIRALRAAWKERGRAQAAV